MFDFRRDVVSAPLGFAPDWPAPAPVRALVTERSGGVGDGRYATLNLATHVGDAAAAVAANRARLRAALPSEPRWLEQVHGSTVLDLDRQGSALPPADGAVTARAGTVCAVLTADCLPVLLCDRAGRRVGVAHAGWRGLLRGVLPAAVAALDSDPSDLLAWLGPAIAPDAYEVGADVRDAYLAVDASAAAHFAPNGRGRWQADLYGLARASLAAAGVAAVFGGDFCTFAESGRFFSHRREPPCGRMATLIWLAEK
ncbi:MAG TPA: peptidoglycan editing factor PgeF [Gammaproteobacteria bacterium]|nr:peptidoglycan editing factor PgeF [Gammaproteobacteria bacterium]